MGIFGYVSRVVEELSASGPVEVAPITWTVEDYVATALNVDRSLAVVLVRLFNEGCEVPFIARYRRHMTGDAAPDFLRHALREYKDAIALMAKTKNYMNFVIHEIQAPDYQKRNLIKSLSKAMDSVELENLMTPFKKKKKTLATIAAELGVAPICEKIMRGEFVNFKDYINSSKDGLATKEKVEKAVLDYLSFEFHRMEETSDYVKEVADDPTSYDVQFRVESTLTTNGKILQESNPKNPNLLKFKLYFQFMSSERRVKEYQILALERGARENIISWKLVIEEAEMLQHQHPCLQTPVHDDHFSFLRRIIADSTKRFVIPNVERIVRRRMLDRAERSAVDCFASNLRELLITAPLKGKPLVAIDPGLKFGCKCVLLNSYGEVMAYVVLNMKRSGVNEYTFNRFCERDLVSLVTQASAESVIIAIGNGKASEMTKNFVSSLNKRNAFAPTNVEFCVASECGSSVYSASDLAIEELPYLDINLRSAVSIGRRVIDPISEYVKIAPRHLGIGSYQHSVNEKLLDETLDVVVRECVSNVGVDVNVASLQVLQKVAGLNKESAANIIKYRRMNGRIYNRETLKKIDGIGPKNFEQCAGFLFIYHGAGNLTDGFWNSRFALRYRNPLDSTPVHPESYHLAEKIVAMADVDLYDVRTEGFRRRLLSLETRLKSEEPELRLVWELLCKPVLVCNPPKLFRELLSSDSLGKDKVVEGVVMNNTQFGAFVDIGVGFNGLIYFKRFWDGPPRVNSRVKVRIMSIDREMNRIQLALA